MRSNRRTVVTIMLAATSLVLSAGAAWAADKNDRKCLDATAKAVQKYVSVRMKELSKCFEAEANPATAQCDLSSNKKVTKAANKRDKTIDKGCKNFDPVRAFGYTGCKYPGCEDQDATADGYKACVECASTRFVGNSAKPFDPRCGNGTLDGVEQCDDGNLTDGDGCSAGCTIEPTCGDSVIAAPEQCDPPGNLAPACAAGETCSMTCECISASVTCGDGVVEGDEECDPAQGEPKTAGCEGGDECNSRCECGPPCDCCDLMPTQLQTTVKVGSGICGQLRNFRCSNNTDAACANDADCNFGSCIDPPGICGGNFSVMCSGSGTPCTGTCGEVVALNLPLDLECGGLYTGGGGNSVPLPFNIPDASMVLSKVLSCDSGSGQITTGAVTRAEADQLTCSEGKKCSGNSASCVLDADCPQICVGGTNDGAPCGDDSECNSAVCGETCESLCLFGAPLPVPNPMTPPTSVCTINVVAEDLTGTGTCDGDSTVNVSLRSEVFLTGDLFQMTTPPDLPGVQPCPLCTRKCAGGTKDDFPCADNADCPGGTCPASIRCLGGLNDGLPCTPGTSDSAVLGDTEGAFPTSHDCPPEPSTTITGNIGGLPIDLEFTTGTQILQSTDISAGQGAQRVFCGSCRDILGAGTLCFEGDDNPGCPPTSDASCNPPLRFCNGGSNDGGTCTGPGNCPGGMCEQTAIDSCGNAVPCQTDADCSDADEYESCAQRTAGAFSFPASTVYSMTGTPAECLADGLGKAAVAVGGFCIPPTFDATVDAAGDLPGPGAVSLAVEAQLLP